MNCTVNIRSQLLPNSAPGGTWTLDGFNTTGIGDPYTGGGSTFNLSGDDPLIDANGATPGYYFFLYDDGCNPPQLAVLNITTGADAGDSIEVDWCIGSQAYDLDSYVTGDTGGVWSLSPDSDPIGVPVEFVLPTGDIETLSDNTPGTWIFLYTVTSPPPDGFTQQNCESCVSQMTVTFRVHAAFQTGDSDTFITIDDSHGSFNLYDLIVGIADQTGAWTQTAGIDSPAITGGYLGTINLDAAAGCHYRFEYSGELYCIDGGGDPFNPVHFIDIIVIRDYSLTITQVGDTLNSSQSGCSSPSYEWFILNQTTNEFDSLGITTNSLDVSAYSDGDEFKLVMNCGDCTEEASFVITGSVCANTPCFDIARNETTDCLTVTNTGTNTSPVSSDVLEWKKDGGLYAPYTGAICGCDFYEFLEVTPYCLAVGANIRVGYSSFSACPTREITRVVIEYGDGTTTTTNSSSIPSYFVDLTPAQWIAKGRSATFRIRILTPIGYIFKKVQFNYTGAGTVVTCSDITYYHLNYPKIYYKIWFRRTVQYSDVCPDVVCESFYEVNNGCLLEVYLNTGNVSDPPTYTGTAVVASTFNGSGISTFVWKLNGSVVPGETKFYIPTTYGNGVYEVIVTNGGCTATDTFVLQTGCSIAVSINISGTNLIASVTGCGASPITYQWYRWTGSTWTALGTSSSQAASQNGLYRVVATCGSCTAEGTINYSVACTSSVTISVAGSLLTAIPSSCSGSPTYIWQLFSGSTWTTVGTGSTYTVSADGLYRVQMTCNGCISFAQYNFVSACAVSVSISVAGLPINPTLTALPSGCSGGVTYLWERWTGSTWTTVGTSSSVVASVAGSSYRVTITCSGCTAQASYFYTGCSQTVSITLTGGGTTLTAFPSGCSGGVTYLWEISLNGGSTWATLSGTGSVITPSQAGLYRVTISCDGCTAQDSYTYAPACSPTLSLAYSSGLLTATTGGTCSGFAIIWQYSPNYNPTTGGCTGWTQVASGVYTYMPTVTGCYRVVTTCGGVCLLEQTLYITIANPCQGITLQVNPGQGVVGWDVLKLNGSPMTNYLISWRDSGTNVEVFKSGKGTYYNAATMYAHPATGVPMEAGTYYPYILNSDAGNNLDCLPDFTVQAIQCGSSPFFLQYNGAGGVAASQFMSLAVNNSFSYIKIGFQSQTVADRLEVWYNGVQIFDSGNVATGFEFVMYAIPFTYVSGVNQAQIKVTNSTPAQNTSFLLYVGCCTALTSCPITLDTNTVTASLNANTCGCQFQIAPTWLNFYPELWNDLCINMDNYDSITYASTGGCGYSYLPNGNYTCSDYAITTSKPIGVVGIKIQFPFAAAARYASIKARLQGVSNPNQYVEIQLKATTCAADGGVNSIRIFPLSGTLIFNDVTREITYEMGSSNPFTTSCVGCQLILHQIWDTFHSLYSSSGSYTFGTFQAIVLDRTVTTAAISVQNITFNELLDTDCGVVERRYRITYRDSGCPCQSWELYEDTDLNGSYETLRQQAAGWTGVCL